MHLQLQAYTPLARQDTVLQWRRNEIHIVGGNVSSMPEGLIRSGLWGGDGKPLPTSWGPGKRCKLPQWQWRG